MLRESHLLLVPGSVSRLGITVSIALSGLVFISAGEPAQAFTFHTGSNIATGSIPALGAAGTARNSFVTAASGLGAVGIENFESAANSNFYGATGNGTLPIGNVTVQVTNGQLGTTTPDNGINDFSGTDQAYGFNTTPSGSKLLRIGQQTGGSRPAQVSITFTFTSSLQAFGIFITDYGNTTNAGAAINAFINGSATSPFPQTIARLNPSGNTGRSVQFFGFTPSAGDPLISSVTFQASGITSIDRFGFDDISFVEATEVPVPPQFVGTALTAMLTAWKAHRSRRKSKQAGASAS
jgi:hypothetical protein